MLKSAPSGHCPLLFDQVLFKPTELYFNQKWKSKSFQRYQISMKAYWIFEKYVNEIEHDVEEMYSYNLNLLFFTKFCLKFPLIFNVFGIILY